MEVLYYTSESTLLEEIVFLLMAISMFMIYIGVYIKNKEKTMLFCAIITVLLLTPAFFIKYQKYGFAKDRITYHIETNDVNKLIYYNCKINHQDKNVWTATNCDLSKFIK